MAKASEKKTSITQWFCGIEYKLFDICIYVFIHMFVFYLYCFILVCACFLNMNLYRKSSALFLYICFINVCVFNVYLCVYIYGIINNGDTDFYWRICGHFYGNNYVKLYMINSLKEGGIEVSRWQFTGDQRPRIYYPGINTHIIYYISTNICAVLGLLVFIITFSYLSVILWLPDLFGDEYQIYDKSLSCCGGHLGNSINQQQKTYTNLLEVIQGTF
jgi:hypothetical protein